MPAYLIVRSEVQELDRCAFDHWYEMEHLPDANSAFKAQAAYRGWADGVSGVHFAVYRFPHLERAREIVASDEIKTLIAEFDRVWQGRVKRTREIFEVTQAL
jgi:hypothetical protein